MLTSLPTNVNLSPSKAPSVVPQNTAPQNPADIALPGQFQMFPVPPAMTKVTASATGGGAAAVTSYFGNEDAFNASVTDNGSGAGSVVHTYGDGWSGKGYNRLMWGLGVEGVPCYGITLEYITTSTGAQLPSGLTTSNPTLLAANLVGAAQIPYGIVLAAGTRNTQYLAGTMTVSYKFGLNSLNQISYGIPVGSTVTLTVLTTPF